MAILNTLQSGPNFRNFCNFEGSKFFTLKWALLYIQTWQFQLNYHIPTLKMGTPVYFTVAPLPYFSHQRKKNIRKSCHNGIPIVSKTDTKQINLILQRKKPSSLMCRTSKLQKIHYHYKKGYIYLIMPVIRHMYNCFYK